MVKSYLRYAQEAVLGLVTSAEGGVVLHAPGSLVVCGALELVLVWNWRTGRLLHSLSRADAHQDSSSAPKDDGPSAAAAAVSALALCSSSPLKVVAGYKDGRVAVWDAQQGVCLEVLAATDAAVTCLRCTTTGLLGASGHANGLILVWDHSAHIVLTRLTGHRGQVCDVAFVGPSTLSALPSVTKQSEAQLLVSAGRDGQVRLWGVRTGLCLQALLLSSPPSCLDVHPHRPFVAVAGAAPHVTLYTLAGGQVPAPAPAQGQAAESRRGEGADPDGAGSGAHDNGASDEAATSAEGHVEFESAWGVRLVECGRVSRLDSERAVTLRFDALGDMLLCQGASRKVEPYKVLSEGESAKREKRRHKRKREGARIQGGGQAEEGGPGPAPVSPVLASSTLKPLQIISFKHKLRSLALSGAQRHAGPVLMGLSFQNNSLEVHSLAADGAASLLSSLGAHGHRSAVRSLALSSEALLLFSVSNSSAKVWSVATGACIATMDSGYGLCCIFAPGNEFALSGTNKGSIEIFGVAAAERVHEVADAHSGAIWSMCPLPDASAFLTASADGNIKLWEYQLTAPEDAQQSQPELRVVQKRCLAVGEDVLSLCVSPNAKYVAAALLDSTIKVFFLDTFRFFLSLYGHKLPVLCCDVSSDSTLLVSGSSDKSVKIWGLDFGDCHRSLFAHTDSVTQVKFVPHTHYFFSAGKDKLIKYWDADRFQQLLVLPGHHAEIWAVAVSPLGGDFFVSGSNDRSIRVWRRTDEPFFVEEEREKQLEALFDATPVVPGTAAGLGSQGAQGEAGEEGAPEDAVDPSKEALWAGDALGEQVEFAAAEEEAERQAGGRGASAHGAPSQNPLLLGLSPSAFALRALAQVRSSELEDALLILPLSTALKLLRFAVHWLAPHPQRRQKPPASLCSPLPSLQVELAARAATALVRLHFRQLTSTPSSRPLLLRLHTALQQRLSNAVSLVGRNAAALEHLRVLHAAQSQSLSSSSHLASKVASLRLQLAQPKQVRIALAMKKQRMEKEERRAKKKQKDDSPLGT